MSANNGKLSHIGRLKIITYIHNWITDKIKDTLEMDQRQNE